MKVHFKLNLAKSDADGYAPIVLHALWKNYKFQFYTSERVLPKYWNTEEQKVRRSHPCYQDINNYLDSLNERVRGLYRGYLSDGIIPIPALLKNDLIPSNSMPLKEVSQNKLTAVFEKFIVALGVRGNKKDSTKHYRKLLNHLIDYQNFCGEVYLGKVDNSFFDGFIEFQRAKFDYHPNTIGNWIKYFKSFLNWCKENNYETGKIKLKKLWVEPEKIYLTMLDIRKLLDAPVSGRLEKVRDVFVFACFTGLRYSDLSKITNENIIDKGGEKYLSFIAQKTNSILSRKVKRNEVPIVPIVSQILSKYKDSRATALPTVSNQKMNEYLKELGQLAGIDYLIETTVYRDNQATTEFVPKYEKITCHVARHTFATLGLINKIPLAVVSKMLGHSDLKTTMIYAKVVDEIKNDEMTRAFGGLSLN